MLTFYLFVYIDIMYIVTVCVQLCAERVYLFTAMLCKDNVPVYSGIV